MKNFRILIFTITAIITTIIPNTLSAASYSAGVNAWYAWIEPSFKDSFMGKKENLNHDNNFTMTEDAAMIYGALFSAQFTDDLAFGAVFSYGTGWECKSDYIYNNGTSDLHVFRNMDKMQRFEGDLTLNYRLTNVFKIFFGWKYYGQRGEGNYNVYFGSTPVGNGTFNIQADSTGPGAGLTSKLNLAENLYFIVSVSGIYMKEYVETDVKGAKNETTKTDNYSTGPNTSANFTYVIPDTSVSLSLGGRYQYLINLDDHSKNQLY
jgi:hypothetical protein